MLFGNLVISMVMVSFSPNGGVKDKLAAHLDATQETVDVAMYSFSDATLNRKLQDAARRGVKVRLLLEQANRERERAEALEAAGVDVRYVTPVLHHKFAVLDGATLVTGSGNWSESSNSRYDEDFLELTDEGATTAAFQREFNHLWRHAREFGASRFGDQPDPAAGTAPVVFTSANMETFVSGGQPSFRAVVEPEDGVAGRTIIAAIDAAEASVDVATTHFRRPDVAAALERALQRGVKVRMVLDGQEFHKNPAAGSDVGYDEALATKGADVRYKTYMLVWNAATALQMHAKFMVVDGRTVLTGSYNWSFNAETGTLENLLTLGAEHAPAYEAEFEKVFGYGGAGGLDALLTDVQAHAGREPCRFAPLALTGKEIVKLRAAYAAGACR